MQTVKIEANVKTPKVPNFLLCTNSAGALNGSKLPLSALDEEGLRAMGEQWTLDLINRATEQRQAK